MAKTQSLVYQAPIGPLKLIASEEGISGLKFLFGSRGDQMGGAIMATQGHERKTERAASPSGKSEDKASFHLEVCKKWLDAYFEGSLLNSDPPPPPKPKLSLAMQGSFSHSVWETLMGTVIGDTLSYKELARLSGSPKAARAVGNAVKSHCVPILVPCHRVVKAGKARNERVSEGSCCLGNYSGGEGPATKMWLLEHEKKMVANQKQLVSEGSN